MKINISPLFTSFYQEWKTPKDTYNILNDEFKFTFDPCPENPSFNGLEIEWGDVNFCNPPYKYIKKWIQKGCEEWKKNKTVVFLVPSRTDTAWWHNYVMKSNEIRFIRKRLRFSDSKYNAPFPSAVVIFKKI